MNTVSAFSDDEKRSAKALLATRVAQMMGRKFEEEDWAYVYCLAKNIPLRGWSNLNIDIMHNGLGVEHKMLCKDAGASLMSYAGTTQMHPSATRSIRIASVENDPNETMQDVLNQYSNLIQQRTNKVAAGSAYGKTDMRIGWLILERSLSEFLYFEQPMLKPEISNYWAKWNESKAGGARKPSKNLWIYEKLTNKKRFSVTTNAGIKIQPYFDVPAPNDPNLVFLKVQGEEVSKDRIQIWLSLSTMKELKNLLGDFDSSILSGKIVEAAHKNTETSPLKPEPAELASPIEITFEAYKVLSEKWNGVNDEHKIRLLIQTIRHAAILG